jgi:photosystem II stability/assembly factor-like uncharacterized protein
VRDSTGVHGAGRSSAIVAVIGCLAGVVGCGGPRGGALCDVPKTAPRPDRVSAKKAFLLEVVRSGSGSALYVETAHGAFESKDSGRSWRRIGPGYNVNSVDPVRPARMTASGSGSLMWTSDGGFHWVRSKLARCATPLDGAKLTSTPKLAYSWGGGGISSSDPWFGGIFRSTDGARSFERVASWEPNAVAVDPNNPRALYAATQDGLFKTTSAGSSWDEIGHGLTDDWWLVTVAPGNSNVIYAVGDGTRFLDSANGEGGNDRILFRTTDGGKTWKKVLDIFDIAGVAIDASDPNVVYVDGEKLGPRAGTAVSLKTETGGATWQTLLTEATRGGPTVAEASEPTGPAASGGSLIADPVHPGVVYQQRRYGIGRSTDGGRTFRLLHPPGWPVPKSR